MLVKNGPIRNVSVFGGSYTDLSAYPKAGTSNDPLVDTDFLHEIQVIAAKAHWTMDASTLFFVFTAAGIRACNSAPCKYSPDFCAAHFAFPGGLYFASIEAPSRNGCTSLFHKTPNHDPVADTAIDIVSHELFESITDPLPCHGWITKCGYDTSGNEIGDLCERKYGHRNSDGSNLVLGTHTYLVQKEWSNRDGRCVLPSNLFPPRKPPSSSKGSPPDLLIGGISAIVLTVVAAMLIWSRRKQTPR